MIPYRFVHFRVLALALTFSACALGSAINVQTVMVGTLADRVGTDSLYSNAIYAQMGMDVNFAPEHLITDYSGTTIARGTNLGIGSVTPNYDQFLGDASWYAPPVITVWYVNNIVGASGIRGETIMDVVGSQWRIGIWVNLSIAANDTLAHELGHALTWYFENGTPVFTCADPGWMPGSVPAGCLGGGQLEAHDKTATNLLAPGSIRDVPGSLSQIAGQGGTYDQITAGQQSFMLLHTDFVVSEPPAIVLLSSGAGLLLFLARRKRW